MAAPVLAVSFFSRYAWVRHSRRIGHSGAFGPCSCSIGLSRLGLFLVLEGLKDPLHLQEQFLDRLQLVEVLHLLVVEDGVGLVEEVLLDLSLEVPWSPSPSGSRVQVAVGRAQVVAGQGGAVARSGDAQAVFVHRAQLVEGQGLAGGPGGSAVVFRGCAAWCGCCCHCFVPQYGDVNCRVVGRDRHEAFQAGNSRIGRQEHMADRPLVLVAVGVLPFGLGVDAHAVAGRNPRGVLADQFHVGPQALAVAGQADDVAAVVLAVDLEMGSRRNGDRDLPALERLERVGPVLQRGRRDLERLAIGGQVIAAADRLHAEAEDRLAVDVTHGLQLLATGRHRLGDVVEGQTETAREICSHDACILGQAAEHRKEKDLKNASKCCQMMLFAMAGCGPTKRATRTNTDGSFSELVCWKSQAGASVCLPVKKTDGFLTF